MSRPELWLALLAAAAEPGFDPGSYPRDSIARVAQADPCVRGKGSYEVKDRLFSMELSWQGAVRKAPQRRFELVRRWAAAVGDPGAADRYRSEVSLSDGKKLHWLAVPEGLLTHLKADLQPGDRALLYLSFVGCAAGAPHFAVDEFEPLDRGSGEEGDVITRDLARDGWRGA